MEASMNYKQLVSLLTLPCLIGASLDDIAASAATLEKTQARSAIWGSVKTLKSEIQLAQGVTKGCIVGTCVNGFGTYRWSASVWYEGEWKNGKQHGRGQHAWANGSHYRGEFRNGLRHGQGILVDAQGVRYVGQFRSGTKNGYGEMFWAPGTWYKGGWRNGLQHGRGTQSNNGTIFSGVWRRGKFVRR